MYSDTHVTMPTTIFLCFHPISSTMGNNHQKRIVIGDETHATLESLKVSKNDTFDKVIRQLILDASKNKSGKVIKSYCEQLTPVGKIQKAPKPKVTEPMPTSRVDELFDF